MGGRGGEVEETNKNGQIQFGNFGNPEGGLRKLHNHCGTATANPHRHRQLPPTNF